MVPVAVDGETVRLATITYKPAGNGPFPTVILHHGSTGRGNDPTLFARPYEPRPLIQWFAARGYAVILPSRRGRGGSEGTYDEGFGLPRTYGYTCDQSLSVPGADRGLRDLDAVMPLLLAQPFVDRSRVAIAGQSRGGILTIAWTGRQPAIARASINFVGGWMGSSCSSASAINQTIFRRGVPFGQSSIWFYGDNDPFYPLSHSRSNFADFLKAGGKGEFHDYVPISGNGHVINNTPGLWTAALEAYLAARGLPSRPQ